MLVVKEKDGTWDVDVLPEDNARKECLKKATEIVCQDREDTYGRPEDNFKIIAKLWTTYLAHEVNSHDVAMMMILLKIARAKTGKFKEDNYIDMAGYSACACEVMKEDKR